MRTSVRLALGFSLSAFAPAAALAGGHAPAAPVIVRPAFHAAAAPGPRVIPVATKPVYGPPRHALYGPPRNFARHGWRHRGLETGFTGLPAVYPSGAEAAAMPARAASSGEFLRPRAAIVTNYNGPPPLWQGDAGYVAQPVIYDVQTVLRRYPLTGAGPRVVK